MTSPQDDPAPAVGPPAPPAPPDPELDRIGALPLEERASALGDIVRKLEAELDATSGEAAAR